MSALQFSPNREAWSEMQTASSKILTRVDDSIPYADNRSAKCASIFML